MFTPLHLQSQFLIQPLVKYASKPAGTNTTVSQTHAAAVSKPSNSVPFGSDFKPQNHANRCLKLQRHIMTINLLFCSVYTKKTNFALVACHTRFCLCFYVYPSTVQSCPKGLEVRARYQTLAQLYDYHCQPVSRDWYWWHCSRSACWPGHVTVYCTCRPFCTNVEKLSSLKGIIKICHLCHSVLSTCLGISKLKPVFISP